MDRLVRFPAEPEWPAPVFPAVRRGGYDPDAVDRYVAVTEAELADLRWQLEDVQARRAALDEERAAFYAERDNWRPSLSKVSSRARLIGRLLDEEEAETRRRLEHEASVAEAAIAERRRLAELAAAERRRDVELEASGIIAQAKAQAERLVTDAEAEAWARRQSAEQELTQLGHRRDLVVEQLEQLTERLLALRGDLAAGPDGIEIRQVG